MTRTAREEIQIRIQGDGLDFRTRAIAGQTIARVMLLKRTGPALRDVPDDTYPCALWGYIIKGRLQMRTTGGEHVYEAGDGFYWAPGHVPVALEDCEYLEISPTDQLEEVVGEITGFLE